jgi:hypothetical protein
LFQANLFCHPWDFVERDIDPVLSLVQGTLGATGLTLAVSLAPQAVLCRRTGAPLRVVRTAGGVAYTLDEDRYAATRCKPRALTEIKCPCSPRDIVEACRARGLGVRLAVSCLRMGRVAGRYPFAAVRNPLDEVSGVRLCPSNPDVVEMVASLVAEIGDTFAPDAVVLQDMDRGKPSDTDDLSLPDAAAGAARLLSLCFCESCHQLAGRAGIDVAAAVRSARVELARQLAAEPEPAAPRVPDPLLEQYMEWQSRSLADALDGIRRRCRTKLLLHRSQAQWDAGALLEGWIERGGSLLTDRLEVPEPGPRGDQHRSGKPAAVAAKTEIAFDAAEVHQRGPQWLVAAMAETAGAGYAGVDIASLSVLTPPLVDAVKQAIRYARRATAP